MAFIFEAHRFAYLSEHSIPIILDGYFGIHGCSLDVNINSVSGRMIDCVIQHFVESVFPYAKRIVGDIREKWLDVVPPYHILITLLIETHLDLLAMNDNERVFSVSGCALRDDMAIAHQAAYMLVDRLAGDTELARRFPNNVWRT